MHVGLQACNSEICNLKFCFTFRQTKPASTSADKSASMRGSENNSGEDRNVENLMEADSSDKNHIESSDENRRSAEAMESEISENSLSGIRETIQTGEKGQQNRHFVFSYR